LADQVRGGRDDASGATGEAKPALLAGGRNQQLVTAAIALHPDEAVAPAVAGETAAELIEHGRRQRPLAFGEFSLDGGKVLLHEGAEGGVLGAMPRLVACDRGGGGVWLARRLGGRRARICGHCPTIRGALPRRSGTGHVITCENVDRSCT
jgi:hypothetical protein